MKHSVSLCTKCDHKYTLILPDPLPSTDLHSTHSPTQRELDIVHEKLSQTNTALSQTQIQIETLQKTMSKLATTRQFLERTRDQYKNYTSVIRRVPSELWSLIFEMAAETAADEWFESPVDERMFVEMTPLNISSVCARWRHVALDTPRMWTFISLDIAHFDSDPVWNAGRSYLRRTIRRTRGLPLSMRLTLPNGYPTLPTFLDDVMNTCASWREVWFEAREDGWLTPTTMHKATDNLPKLESFAVYGPRDQPGMMIQALSFSVAPKLRHLRVQTDFVLADLNFRTQIQSIHFDQCGTTALFNSLHYCPNVETVIMEDTKVTHLDHVWRQNFRSVTTLDVRSTRGGFDERSIRGLVLPQLTSLYLSQSSKARSFPMRDVITLLKRSKTNLTHLEITGVEHMNPGHLVDFIQLSPNLETLIIKNPQGHHDLMAQQIIHALTYNEETNEEDTEEDSLPNPLLPKLTRLEVSVEDNVFPDILTMLESRKSTASNTSRLEYVSVGLFKPPDPPSEKWVRSVPRVDLSTFSTRLKNLQDDGGCVSVFHR